MHVFLWVMLAIFAGSVFAQTDAPPPISADNVRSLALARIVTMDEFTPAEADHPPKPLSGWFALSPDGLYAATVVEGGTTVFSTADGTIAAQLVHRDPLEPDRWSTAIDIDWSDDSDRFALLLRQGETDVIYVAALDGTTRQQTVPAEYGVPVRVWIDAEDGDTVWIETIPNPSAETPGGHNVVRLTVTDDATDGDPQSIPTGPEADFDSYVRIGRIPAPRAITATFNGTVRLWDLQTGDVTAEVALPVLPTFGRVNETNGQQFAWRDEFSEGLHLLDFTTGEDRVVAPLDGEYVQALLLTPDADVILAVHRGETPSLTAWISATGEEIALGEYETSICSRVPDMVQLAHDGTRLVIGCDGGFQVWEVAAGS
ncbi:MAG: hypothetical protein IPM16_16780 [Chloroflexi bacterium]|nr:hypothetical protein [Chloroflexota bacterium]